jgi:hypothetical protein
MTGPDPGMTTTRIDSLSDNVFSVAMTILVSLLALSLSFFIPHWSSLAFLLIPLINSLNPFGTGNDAGDKPQTKARVPKGWPDAAGFPGPDSVNVVFMRLPMRETGFFLPGGGRSGRL